MENSVRRKKDHRKLKRDEIKERKMKEKEKKMVEVKLKKKLKKKEIEDKIEELKKLTGNDQLAFEVSTFVKENVCYYGKNYSSYCF